MYTSVNELQQAVRSVFHLDGNTPHIIDEQKLRETTIDPLVFTAIFASDLELKTRARTAVREIAAASGVRTSSIHNYYMAIGAGAITPTSTVPAINIRTMTYDIARLLFQLMKEQNIGPLVFELARSEMGYTNQSLDDYAIAVLAAAIKEDYRGPVFLQADHVQVNARRYQEDPVAEIQSMKDLIKDAIEAGVRNIDVDASTLVDLSKPTLPEQQVENYKVAAELTEYIRALQPKDAPISIGAEIGHIGGKNSTPEELEAFMEGYQRLLHPGIAGISKMSVQMGTSHGGIPLADGQIADVKLDFSVLEHTGEVAREKYHLGGVVQHGASTLPHDLFHFFPQKRTLEIHLATGFQNIIYDQIPAALRQRMYDWVERELQHDWKAGWSKEQFIYTSRKRAFGPFKKDLWQLSEQEKWPIKEHLRQQFRFLFDQLNVIDTQNVLDRYV